MDWVHPSPWFTVDIWMGPRSSPSQIPLLQTDGGVWRSWVIHLKQCLAGLQPIMMDQSQGRPYLEIISVGTEAYDCCSYLSKDLVASCYFPLKRVFREIYIYILCTYRSIHLHITEFRDTKNASHLSRFNRIPCLVYDQISKIKASSCPHGRMNTHQVYHQTALHSTCVTCVSTNPRWFVFQLLASSWNFVKKILIVKVSGVQILKKKLVA